MGGVSSKSPLERRNAVARRSQRRTLHSLKPKIDDIYKDIKKFKGVTEDQAYFSIKNKIEHLKAELNRRGQNLQPQVKTTYDAMSKRAREAQEDLDSKLLENQERVAKKESEKQDKKKDVKKENDLGSDSDVEVQEEEDERNGEEHRLNHGQEKRKTVELKFVQIVPDASVPTSPVPGSGSNASPNGVNIRSPEEKRKSILKMGVPVMPGAMMNEITNKSRRISTQYEEQYNSEVPPKDIAKEVNNIIENLQSIELKINDFVGRKHGTQYNRIRDELNKYLIELNQFNTTDEETVEQIKISKNYVGSCLNFLNEKAVEDSRRESFTSEDDVFENNNLPGRYVDANTKLQHLLKNTPV